MPQIRMTLEAKLLYGVAGSTAATEITNIVGDLTQTMDADKVQINARGTRIKSYKPGEMETSLAWQSNWKDGDTALEAIQTAFINGTALAFRTKDYTSGKGWDADFIVNKFQKNEAKGSQQTVDIEIAPNDELRAAQIYV